MKVKWSENAGKEFASLVAYVAHEFGNKVALKLRDEIFSCVKRISEFPQLGMSSFVDEMTNVEFRGLKAGLNSVVYSIYNNEIYTSLAFGVIVRTEANYIHRYDKWR